MDRSVVVGAFLGSIALVACSSASSPPTSKAADPGEEVGSASAALTPAHPVRADGFLPGVIPFRGGPQRAAVQVCNSPRLFYFGGPLIQSPVIVAVFWNSSVNAAIQTNIGQFYADVTLSSYWPWLHEYDSVGLTPGTQTILPGSFGGNVTLVPQHCPASTTGACNLTDANIQTELIRQIGLGVLPAPTLDCTGNTKTVYMIDFPPNISVGGPDGAGKSCVNGGFCGYHNTTTYGTSQTPLIYGVLMDVFAGGCSEGCGGSKVALQNATSVHSHELVEAVTDPDIGLDFQADYAAPAGWGDNNNQCGEIADICDDGSPGDTITVSGRTWTVQELWSNQQGKCTSTGPAPKAVCSGTMLTNCRFCSCGDDGVACSGATPVCETETASPLFGACEACTATSGTCTGGATCVQDKCVGAPDAGPEAGDAGGDAHTDAAGEAGNEAGVGVDAAPDAERSGSDSGNDADRDTGSDAQSEPGRDAEGTLMDAELAFDAPTESGRAGEDASNDARELDTGTEKHDSSVAAEDASAGSALDGGAFDDGSSDGDPNRTAGVGDNSGCGCRVAQPASSSSPALFGFGALTFVAALRVRRKRGART